MESARTVLPSATERHLTSVRKWQAKQKAFGRCVGCAQPSAKFFRCLRCRLQKRDYRKARKTFTRVDSVPVLPAWGSTASTDGG